MSTGRGFVHGIILSSAATGAIESLTLYDNTDATGNVLIKINSYHYDPAVILFDRIRPLAFTVGLTAKTSTNGDAFVILEA